LQISAPIRAPFGSIFEEQGMASVDVTDAR
jgi:hypothetical protein